MKQVLFSIAILFFSPVTNAQVADKAHGWLLGIGTGVANTDLNNSQFQTRYQVKPVLTPIRNINVSVKYLFSSKLAIGVTAGLYHSSGYSEENHVATPTISPTSADYQVLYSSLDYLRHTVYVTAEGSYTYYKFKKGNVRLYGTAGFGITHTTGYVDHRVNAVNVNWPPYATCFFGSLTPPAIDENKMTGFLAPIGIRGGKNIGWYAEAGYGYKGILNAGVSVRIK